MIFGGSLVSWFYIHYKNNYHYPDSFLFVFRDLVIIFITPLILNNYVLKFKGFTDVGNILTLCVPPIILCADVIILTENTYFDNYCDV